MHMTEQSYPKHSEVDFLGRLVVVSTHFIGRLEQIREDLREYMVDQGDGYFRVSGFVLGRLVDVSVNGQFWIEFPWNASPIPVQRTNVVRILLDDEGEPEFVGDLPRLVQ